MEHFSLSPLQIILRIVLTFLSLFTAFAVIILIMVNFPGLSVWIWLLLAAAVIGIGALILKKQGSKNE